MLPCCEEQCFSSARAKSAAAAPRGVRPSPSSRRTPSPRCAALFGGWFGGSPAAPPAEEVVADEREPAPAELLPLLDGTVLQGERLVLAYRAARDGWTASAFHAAVDSRGPLLLVGRTTQGQRFGAYVSVGFASREDYRDTNSAFLLRWSDGDDAAPEVLPRTGPPAVFDFAAQGPCFGADALRIPLGLAPAQGSSYAAVTGSGGGGVLGPSHAAGSRAARSRLGSHYAVRRDGGRTLFADGEGMDATLVELEGFVSPGREGAM